MKSYLAALMSLTLCVAPLVGFAQPEAVASNGVPASAATQDAASKAAAQQALLKPGAIARRPVSTRNVRVTLTLTDTFGGDKPVVKTVTLVVADGRQGAIRSTNRLRNGPNLPLNVDADVSTTPAGQIAVKVTFNYTVFRNAGEGSPTEPSIGQSDLSETLELLLTPGQTLTAAESADAASDRKVKVEVKAEFLP